MANIGGVCRANGSGQRIFPGSRMRSVGKYGLNFDGTIVKKADSKASVYAGKTGDFHHGLCLLKRAAQPAFK
ncbi:MAG: hypothetical protein ACLTT1_01730 [[Clostridium] scindens]